MAGCEAEKEQLPSARDIYLECDKLLATSKPKQSRKCIARLEHTCVFSFVSVPSFLLSEVRHAQTTLAAIGLNTATIVAGDMQFAVWLSSALMMLRV